MSLAGEWTCSEQFLLYRLNDFDSLAGVQGFLWEIKHCKNEAGLEYKNCNYENLFLKIDLQQIGNPVKTNWMQIFSFVQTSLEFCNSFFTFDSVKTTMNHELIEHEEKKTAYI